MMSIALDPIVKDYHYQPVNSGHADLATATQSNLAGSRTTVDSRASDRTTAAGLQFLYTLAVLVVCGAFLACAGWLCFELLASLQAQLDQLESLSTRQLLHALAGA